MLSETETWLQVATQETRGTVSETFLIMQILKSLPILEVESD